MNDALKNFDGYEGGRIRLDLLKRTLWDNGWTTNAIEYIFEAIRAYERERKEKKND